MEVPDRSADSASTAPAAGASPERSEARGFGSAHLRALSRVSAALCGLSDLQAILRVGLDSVYDLLRGASGGILLLDEDTQTLSYRIAYGLPSQVTRETLLEVGEGIAGRVIDTGRAIMLQDISVDPDASHESLSTAELPLEGIRALVSIPLRSRHRIFGAINVASRQPRSFGSDDIYVLHSIGEQMGVAIERAEVLEQVTAGRETYQRMARHYLVAQDEERRRIARELHDETSQSLSALALNVRALVEMAEMSGCASQELVERMKRVESMAQETAHELTRIINDLRPGLLDSAGLLPAIRRYAEDQLEPQDIHVTVEALGTLPRLPPEVEATIFRFTQGAVSNIARHADAKNVHILVDPGEDRLVLRISDDGCGFDVSSVNGIDEATGRGRGVLAMKERMRLVGGSCEVGSRPGKGTTVVAEIPIKDLGDVQDTSPGSR